MKRRYPLLITYGIRIFAVFSFGMIFQARLREMGASVFLIGLVSTVGGGVSTISSSFWGTVSDYSSKRIYLIIFSILSSSLIYPFFAFQDNITVFFLLVALVFFLREAFEPSSMALCTEYSDGSKGSVSRELSFLNASGSAGMFLGRIFLSVLFLFLIPKNIIVVFSIISFLPFFSALMIKEGSRQRKVKSVNLGFFGRFFPLLKNPAPLRENGLWAIYAGSFFRQMAVSGSLSVILIYLTENVGLSAFVAVILSSMNPFTQIFSHLFSGKIIRILGPKKSASCGIFLTAALPLLFAFADSWVLIAVGYIFLGTAFGAFFNGVSTFISVNTPPERRAEFLGFLSSIRAFGSMLGPVVAGIAALLSFRVMYFSMGLILILSGFIVALFAKEKRY